MKWTKFIVLRIGADGCTKAMAAPHLLGIKTDPVTVELLGLPLNCPDVWLIVVLGNRVVDKDGNIQRLGLDDLDAANFHKDKHGMGTQQGLIRFRSIAMAEMFINTHQWSRRDDTKAVRIYTDEEGRRKRWRLIGCYARRTVKHLCTRNGNSPRQGDEPRDAKVCIDMFVRMLSVLSWNLSIWGCGL